MPRIDSPGRLRGAAAILLTLSPLLAPIAQAVAQDLPKHDYYHFMPLSYTRPVRQAAGTAALHLYGDENDPSYRDADPVDGMDDRRVETLRRMGVRFAPYLVLNTTAVPMDWKKFMNGRTSWPLYVDTWNQAVEGGELIREEQIDWLRLEASPCPEPLPSGDRAENDDCRLLSLLEEFDPESPQSGWYRKAAIDPQVDPIKMLYWNFPGHGEASWKSEYQDRVSGELPTHYWNFVKTYLHPFVEEVRSNTGGLLGYDLVLQYWFFYPWNDGGNNHEGDWEHVNLVVAPKGAVGRPQTAEEIAFMLGEGGIDPSAGEDYVVIKRADYYFHENVWTFDYARPNVYLPREDWEAQLETLPQNRIDQVRMWRMIRERAYEDAAETVINTHIVGFIGADNKGNDQLLAAPGGKNRDSHGTYPFRGLYKNVGPAGASEQITARFGYAEYFAGPRPGLEDGRLGHNSVVRLDRPDRVEIVPDWERVYDLMRTNPAVRREWSWLVLPIRWGYPATDSPFAGVIGHANTGNLAPQVGSQNKGWNRGGSGSGFSEYSPHRYSGYFALGWQDGFHNNWGWLNSTLPTVAIMPPFDIAFKVLASPIELLTQQSPTFLQANEVPFRFFALEFGGIHQTIPDDFSSLLLNRDQVGELVERLGYAGTSPADITVPVLERNVETSDALSVRASLFVGRRMASENAFWAPRSQMSGHVLDASNASRYITTDLKMWEYAGSLRYNLARGAFQPYAKLGYGMTWYRLENTAVDGVPLQTTMSDIVNPFVWHWGIGIEYLPIASIVPPPKGVDFGIRVEFADYHHSLALDEISDPAAQFLGTADPGRGVRRDALAVSFTIGF